MFKTVFTPKPIQRSALRQYLGKRYFIAKRWWQWQRSPQSYATKRESSPLPHLVFQHQSTLLRKLKDVDMWLQHNKIENLRLALEQLNGVVIQPGEVFSFWKLVGKPSKRKGFKEGMVLKNGAVHTGTGGGLCQLGNLLFWMALHSPLTITERWRHGFDVFPDVNRKVPFGSGATLSYNYIDLQLKNETSQPFQFQLWLTEKKLHGSLLCEQALENRYEIVETEHQIRQEMWGGYTRHNLLSRRTIDRSGNCLSTIPVVENHAIMMYNPLLPHVSREDQ